jgi:hypothetical protein
MWVIGLPNPPTLRHIGENTVSSIGLRHFAAQRLFSERAASPTASASVLMASHPFRIGSV